jgi:hypothetical protein
MNVEVNLLAVLLATASTMVVGSIWYTPKVFGNLWMKLIGKTEKDLGKNATPAILITIVVSFFSAYVLAHVTYLSQNFFGNSFLASAFATAFWLWLGMTAARFITHDAFERRPVPLTLLNIMHELVTFMIMALIIGLMQP